LQESIHAAMAAGFTGKVKCSLCLENKDYCDPAAGVRRSFQSRCDASGIRHLPGRIASRKRVVSEASACFWRDRWRHDGCGGIAASIVRFGVHGVSQRRKPAPMAACAVIEAANRIIQKSLYKTMSCEESLIAAAC
jgi:hypothetical protein